MHRKSPKRKVPPIPLFFFTFVYLLSPPSEMDNFWLFDLQALSTTDEHSETVECTDITTRVVSQAKAIESPDQIVDEERYNSGFTTAFCVISWHSVFSYKPSTRVVRHSLDYFCLFFVVNRSTHHTNWHDIRFPLASVPCKYLNSYLPSMLFNWKVLRQ